MNYKGSSLSVWQITNAWREVFARIFEGIHTQFNVSPKWLVNPATNRRLKLDMLYPEIGVAVRLEGLQGKQRKSRPSLEEETQQRVRAQARTELSQAHEVDLIVVDVINTKPQSVFQEIDIALSRAGQRAQRVKNKELSQQIRSARTTAASLARKIIDDSHLKLYAELWADRQYQLAEPAQSTPPAVPSISFTQGMEVEHTIFGPGVVLATAPSNGDTLITVDFITAGEKTLAASLIGDKLLPR